MVKKTKNSNLSLEERLEQVLIPNWDEPYKLPENWCWVRIDAIASIYTGNSINERVKEEKYTGQSEGLIYLATKDIGFDSTIDYETNIRIPNADGFKVAPKFSTLLCIEGGSAGRKVGFVTQDVCFVNKLCAFVPHAKINPKYLYYVIQSDAFKKQFDAKKHGLIGGVSIKEVMSIYIPLAPTEQQTLIVERIESAFHKLDEATEKSQEVIDGFETRKAAILHKAFAGELTAKWRKENTHTPACVYLEKLKNDNNYSIRSEIKYWNNESLPAGWCESKIGNLLYFAGRIGWKGLKAEEYTDSGPLLLSVYNLNDGDEVTYNHVYHITQERYEESPEIMVEIGDILLTKDGAGIGKLGYVKDLPEKATINSSLLLLRPSKSAISKYIYYVLLGPALQNIVKERITGSATPHLFQRDIKEFVLPIPSLEEQIEIVRVLDNMLLNENKSKEFAELVLEQIDAIKKSILVRAFRGELGTNNINEGSAVELLKKVFDGDVAVQTPAKKPTKRISIPSDIKELLSNIREEEIIKLLLKSAPQPVSIQKIMALNSKKFELMDALRSLEKKQLITKNESGEYSLTR